MSGTTESNSMGRVRSITHEDIERCHWHRRLGHPSDSAFDQIMREILNRPDLVLEQRKRSYNHRKETRPTHLRHRSSRHSNRSRSMDSGTDARTGTSATASGSRRPRDPNPHFDCDVCRHDKMGKRRWRTPLRTATAPLERVYVGLETAEMQYDDESLGERPVLVLDDYTRYAWSLEISGEGGKGRGGLHALRDALRAWLAAAERGSGCQVKTIVIRTRRVNGLGPVQSWLEKGVGATVEWIDAGVCEQAEDVMGRHTVRMLETVVTLCADAGLMDESFAGVMACATYLRNRTVFVHQVGCVTPYELWFGRKPELGHLRTLGCKVKYLCNPRGGTPETGTEQREGVFAGYYGDVDGHYWVLTEDGTKVVSKDVLFDEGTRGFTGEPPTSTVLDIVRPADLFLTSEAEQRVRLPSAGDRGNQGERASWPERLGGTVGHVVNMLSACSKQLTQKFHGNGNGNGSGKKGYNKVEHDEESAQV